MSFSCVCDRRSIRHLHRLLVCLSKIGLECNFEPTQDSILLRTLAQSHAVFALVQLRMEFFQSGSFVSQPIPNQSTQTQTGAGTGTGTGRESGSGMGHKQRESQHISQPSQNQREPSSSISSSAPSAVYPKCKISFKHLLLVFRHAGHAERLEWRMKANENKMWFTITVGGIKSTYGSVGISGGCERRTCEIATNLNTPLMIGPFFTFALSSLH